MRELCHRNGIKLPVAPSAPWSVNKPAVRVFVIYNRNLQSASDIIATLGEAIEHINGNVVLSSDVVELLTADRVLLLLTEGVGS